MNDFPSLWEMSTIAMILLVQHLQVYDHKIERNIVLWRHFINAMKGDETQKGK